MAEGHHRQSRKFDLQQSKVGVGIAADQLGGRDAAVGELYLDLLGILDDVVVGGDMPRVVQDHAGTQAAVHALAIFGPHVAEQRRQLFGETPLHHHALGRDVHDRRCGLRDGVGVAQGGRSRDVRGGRCRPCFGGGRGCRGLHGGRVAGC